MSRTLLLRAILLMLVSTVSTAAQDCGQDKAMIVGDVAIRLDTLLARESVLGFSGGVLAMQHGEIRLLKTYGFADRSRPIPNSPSTRFPIASVTKQFTAAAALQLVARGKLRLSDRMDRYMSPLPSPYPAPTIAHLLTHTSGIIRTGTTFTAMTREAFLSELAAASRESAPGERHRYSNAGYALLAVVVEAVAHVPFETYVESNLFQPAGMRCTTFISPGAAPPPAWAIGYEMVQPTVARLLTTGWAHRFAGTLAPLAGKPEFQSARPLSLDWTETVTGGVATTLGDIARWERALRAGALVPNTDQLFVPRIPGEAAHREQAQGYAWMLTRARGDSRLAFHGGDYWGYQCGYYRYLDSDWILFVASNSSLGRGIQGWPEVVRADFESFLCGSGYSCGGR